MNRVFAVCDGVKGVNKNKKTAETQSFRRFLLSLHNTMSRGRDKELIRLRDEALCRRYYYWTETQRLRFDDALRILSEREFFISEERIMAIIRRKSREGTDKDFKPLPKVKVPRLTASQLELFKV